MIKIKVNDQIIIFQFLSKTKISVDLETNCKDICFYYMLLLLLLSRFSHVRLCATP